MVTGGGGQRRVRYVTGPGVEADEYLGDNFTLQYNTIMPKNTVNVSSCVPRPAAGRVCSLVSDPVAEWIG